jgi:hypothetical protein
MTRRPLLQIRPWSHAEDATLRELLDLGLSLSAIRKKLRRNETTIIRRMQLLNIRRTGLEAPSDDPPA